MSHYSRFNGLKWTVFVIQGFYEALDFLKPLTYTCTKMDLKVHTQVAELTNYCNDTHSLSKIDGCYLQLDSWDLEFSFHERTFFLID